MSPDITSRRELLQTVVAKCAAESYTRLAPEEDFNPLPLLYFGDPCSAEFATFGLNPAADELNLRRWPLEPKMTIEELDDRLVNYFKKNDRYPQPNDWFDGYEAPDDPAGYRALNLLGHSYRTDTVHLDFSPRATIPRTTMGRRINKKDITVDQRKSFVLEYKSFVLELRKLIASDLCHFVSALALCRNLRAAIMAGTVANDPNRDYLYQILRDHLPEPYHLEFRRFLEEPRNGAKRPRNGATALYDLVGPDLNIPVLFVSTSPSKDKGTTLAQEVERNLDILQDFRC